MVVEIPRPGDGVVEARGRVRHWIFLNWSGWSQRLAAEPHIVRRIAGGPKRQVRKDVRHANDVEWCQRLPLMHHASKGNGIDVVPNGLTARRDFKEMAFSALVDQRVTVG